MEAENQRLRKALLEIADSHMDCSKGELITIARDALEIKFLAFDFINYVPPPRKWKYFEDGFEFKKNGYWIEKERINTLGKLVHWINHLAEKDWGDSDHISHLIQVWGRVFEVDVYNLS